MVVKYCSHRSNSVCIDVVKTKCLRSNHHGCYRRAPLHNTSNLQQQKTIPGGTLVSKSGTDSTGPPELDNRRLGKNVAWSDDFCSGIWMVVSEFGVNMNAWTHNALYQWLRLLLVVNAVWDIYLVHFDSLRTSCASWNWYRLAEYCWWPWPQYAVYTSSEGHFQQNCAMCAKLFLEHDMSSLYWNGPHSQHLN